MSDSMPTREIKRDPHVPSDTVDYVEESTQGGVTVLIPRSVVVRKIANRLPVSGHVIDDGAAL